METSSEDIVKDIAEGVTRGIVKETKESILALIDKLRNGKLGFIQDPDTIEVVKEQRKVGELNQYKTFVEDKEKIDIIILGLALRRLDNQNNHERVQNLRGKIYLKYRKEGLHIAQVVQNGILNRYILTLLEQGFSIAATKPQVKSFLENIEKHVCFVASENIPEQIAEEVKIKITAHSPNIFVLSGTKSAMKITIDAYNLILESKLPYAIEKYSGPKRELYFFSNLI